MGPCLCGDPYCPSCGNPEAAKIEAAEAELLGLLAKECQSADDYQAVGRIAVVFLAEQRRAVKNAIQERMAILDEINSTKGKP